MRTSWNDDEDEALRKLPWRARVIYLQGIRRHMDFRTGWAGKTRVLSYQFFFELLECSEHTTAPDPDVTKDGLRAIFKMLERVGLVEWPRGSSQQRGVFFRCLLADVDQSVQKQDAPKTHPRRTQEDAPSESSNSAAPEGQDAPKTHPCCNCEDAPPPVSGIREDSEANASGADAPAADPKTTIWNLGERYLGSRAFVGKLIKQHGEADVFHAIAQTATHNPADPVAYIQGLLRANGNGAHRKDHKPRNNAERAEQWAEECWSRVRANAGVD